MPSTQFPYFSTQLQAGYMGQQLGYTQHELFEQYNNVYPYSGVLLASPLPDKREVILREIEKERIRAQMMVFEIEKMRILEEKIGKEVTGVAAADIRVSEVKHGTQNEQEEEGIVLMANPDATIFGSKSKAVTPPVSDTSKHPSDNILYEKAEVIATSESALNEASLKLQSPGKNSSIGKIAPDTVLKQTELLENPKPDNLKNDQETIQSVQKNGDPKKTTYSFWCEMCQVGTLSEIVINDHEKGKKHLRRLEERAIKGETGESNQKEEIDVRVNSIDHISDNGKSILSHNTDVVLDESRLKLQKPLDASANGFETFPVQIRAADHRDSEVVPLTEYGNEEETIIFVVNPDATISRSKSKAVTPSVADNNKCPSDNNILYEKAEIVATTESALNEASLKPQSPGKNTIVGKIAADIVLLKQTELLEKQKPGNLKKDQAKTNQSVQMNGDLKKTKFSFWREMCQIGTPSEIVTNGHEKGKKHLRLLKEKAQKDDAGVDNHEKIEVPVNCVEHVSESEKSIPSCNVDVVLAEARSDLHKHLDESDNGFETFPIQIRAADLRVSEVMPVTKKRKEDKLIFAANPDATISGSKLKAVTPPVADISKHPSDILYEKAEVIAVSESVLNGASLKPQSPEKNSCIGKIADGTVLKKTELLECPKPDNLKRDQEKTNRSVQKNGDPKKIKYSFWCDMCQVGPLSEIFMNDHEKGKKHLRRLEGRAQKGGTWEGPVNSVDHVSDSRKGISSCHVDVVLVEERFDLHKPLDASDNGHKIFPIQIRAADHRVSEAMPMTGNCNEEETIIFMANPDATKSGSKLNTVTPPIADISKHPSDEFLNKKAEVIVTTESASNGCPGKNSSIEKIAAATVLEQTELLRNSKSDNFKKDQENTDQSAQKNGNPKKTTYSFWRELCKVETLSEIVMNDHEKEKKHIKRLEEIAQKGETGEGSKKEKIEVPVNSFEHTSESGKNILTCNVAVVLDEARLELRKPLNASDNGFETSPVQIRAADRRVSEVTPLTKNCNEEEKYMFVVSPNANVSGSKLKAVTPPVSDTNKSAMKDLCEKKYKLKEDSSKSPSPAKHSVMGKVSCDTLLSKKTELLVNLKSENFRKDQAKTIQTNVKKNNDPKKIKESFWREKYQVGNSFYKVVNDVDKGKTHHKILQVDDTGSCEHKEKINEPVSCDTLLSKKTELLVNLKSENIRKDQAKTIQTNVKKNDDPKKIKERFWREKYQVGNSSYKVVNDVDKGKTHHKILQVDDTGSCEHKEKINEPVSCDTLLSKKTELLVNLKSENIRKDQAKTIQTNVKKNDGPKKIKERFWREKYQVGNSSYKVVNDVDKGKTHHKILQIDDTGSCEHKEKINESVNRVKHVSEGGKIIFSHILTKQDAKAAGVDIIRPGDSSTLPAVSPKDGKINAKSEWNCDLCQVIAANKSSLKEHLCGKKHKLKEASLKAQRPRNNSSIGNVAADTLLEDPKSDNIKKDSAKTVRNVGKKGDLKKTTYSYWRQSSQVEPSDKVTHNLEKGKESVQNDESGPCNQKEKMEVPVNHVEHVSTFDIEKNILSEFFGVVFG